jgi:ribokinase
MKAFDVVGLGYCAVDYLCVVPRYPGLDEKIRILDFLQQGGGITATAMATVGRLGGRARFIGKVGDDPNGQFTLMELRRDNVDVDAVVIQPGAKSQYSFIVVDKPTGKRTIFWSASNISLSPSEIRREDVLAGKVLHVDVHHARAAILAASWANMEGVPVVWDAGSAHEGSDELAQHTDYLIASELFAEQFLGERDPERAAVLLAKGRKLGAVTLGENGCWYATADGVSHQPAFKVDAVDTTGAGDVFHGAFSFGLSKDWPIREIIEFSTAVAAIKCTKLGGRTGIPTFSQAIDFLRHRSTNAFWLRF